MIEGVPAAVQERPFPYAERNGVNAEHYVNALLAEPEVVLSEGEKEAAYAFAHCLYEGRVHPQGGGEPIVCDSRRNLSELYDDEVAVHEQRFYTGYFATEQGSKDLALLGLPSDASETMLADTLHNQQYIKRLLATKQRKEIATRSLKWQKRELAAQLGGDPALDASQHDLASVMVNYEPDALLDKLEDLQAYRRFYRQVWQDMKRQQPSDLRDAKQALLEVHVSRVNNMVANLYPHAVVLAKQVDYFPYTAQSMAWANRLAEVVPIVSRAYKDEEADLARRLDLIRNGAAWRGNLQASPVSVELEVLQVESPNQATVMPDSVPTCTEAERTAMDAAVWRAGDMKVFNEAVLAELGLLSEHEATWDEVEERIGPPDDDGWQVVIIPKNEGLNVNGSKHVLGVSQTFERTLTQQAPAGALPVSAHELAHIRQAQFDKQLAERIPLAYIRGSQAATAREMGGKEEEHRFHATLGRNMPTNFHYLRALQAKLAGGTRLQTARAFYDSYVEGRTLTAAEAAKARDLAADRTARLYRLGGHNSQPLDYAEQELMALTIRSLDKRSSKRVVAATNSFSFKHAAQLHRFGLLDLPTAAGADEDPFETVLRTFRRDFLPGILTDAAHIEP